MTDERTVAEVAAGLSAMERSALMPNSTACRRPLLAKGLVRWKRRAGNRWDSLMPTSFGYAVRDYLLSRGGEG